MIITARARGESARTLFEVPLLGAALGFLVAMAPPAMVALMVTPLQIGEWRYLAFPALWNALLAFGFGVSVRFFLVPCWLLFSVLTVLHLSGIVEG